MLIDPHTNLLHQWKQKQFLLDQLQIIANLPVTSLSQQKNLLEKQFSDFVFQSNMDSLFGGLLVSGHKDQLVSSQQKYYKPAITNIYLAELLIAADQVFYHGTFSFIGKQIVEYLLKRISNDESSQIITNQYFNQENLDCYFSDATLKYLLEQKEEQLLLALTTPDLLNKKDIGGRLVSYCRSLREAAAGIDIHYKEAQILEFSLLDKLTKGSVSKKACSTDSIENYFEVNCELLAMLSKSLFIEHDSEKGSLSKEFFYKLYRKLMKSDNNQNLLINLIYSGILLLQVDFDHDIVTCIDKMTLQLGEGIKQQEADEKQKMQLDVIKLFQYRKNPKLDSLNTQLVFLSKQQIDLDVRLIELKAKFNPYRLVFVI